MRQARATLIAVLIERVKHGFRDTQLGGHRPSHHMGRATRSPGGVPGPVRPVPDHRAVRRGPRCIGRAGRYHSRRLLRNQPVRQPGRGIRTRQVGPPATHCRWSGDHDRRRIQLLAGPDVGAVDRRKGDAWDWRGSAGAGCVLHDRRSSTIRQVGSGHGPDRGPHRRRGPGGTSGRRNPARHVGRRRGLLRRLRCPTYDTDHVPVHRS